MNAAPASSRARFDTAKLAMAVTLTSETFFFGVLISTYLFIRTGLPWQGLTITASRMVLPAANTLLLLVSALTTYLGVRAIRQDSVSGLLRWFSVSLALGLVFIAGQILEWTGSGMVPATMIGGVFLTLMGFHALHMIAGVTVHAIAIARARQGDFSAQRHIAVEVSAWFWYFVVAVWAVLFTVLYLV